MINLFTEKGMSVARINMLEFETEDHLSKRAELYEKDAPTLFPNAEILLTIKTGPTTAMSVSIYPDEKSAEKALIRRDKHFKTAETVSYTHLTLPTKRIV